MTKIAPTMATGMDTVEAVNAFDAKVGAVYLTTTVETDYRVNVCWRS